MAATTLDDIANWVMTDVLKRTDIQSVVRTCALNVYRMICAAVPFDELMVTSAELPMIAQTSSYDLAAAGPTQLTPSLRALWSIRVTFDSNNRRRVRRSHTRLYDSLSTIPFSRSATYARWANSLEFNPPPDSSAYTFRVRYWSRPTIASPNPETTTILTPLEWDELLRWETLYRAYYELDMIDKAQALMAATFPPKAPSSRRQRVFETAIIPRLWNDLLTTVSAKENTDEDFSINPLNRNYSARVGGGW